METFLSLQSTYHTSLVCIFLQLIKQFRSRCFVFGILSRYPCVICSFYLVEYVFCMHSKDLDWPLWYTLKH